MTPTQLEEHRYSTSDIERSPTVGQERFSFDSQPSIDVSLLDSSYRDEPVASDPDSCTLSVHDTDRSTVSLNDQIIPNFSFEEKDLEFSRGWPALPQPLKTSFGSILWSVTIDVVLLAIAVAFLVFAWSVVLYDQKPTNFHPQAAQRFEQASKWTGQRIAVLDTLAGSTSLTSTVVSQVHLRRVSYVGFGLVAIWMLSPVGGQSSFRQITFGPRHASENTTYLYVAPGPQMWVPDGGTTESNLNSIFTAALLSSATQEGSPRDPWGHIKVPRVQYYEKISSADDQGWYKTENGTEDTYSSLIGIPMSGIDSTDFVEYAATIEAMYFHLDCEFDTIPGGLDFEGYLNDPKDPRSGLRSGFALSSQRPTSDSATRLGQMLNTYWAAMNGKNVFTSGVNEVTIWTDPNISWEYQDTSQDLTEVPSINGTYRTNSTGIIYKVLHNGTNSTVYEASYNAESAYLARAWESSGTKRSSTEVFQAHWGWVVALMISSTVLITASLIPFYLRTFFLRGPDILMNISSLATRESTYLALPTTGTYLSASDRSRCLKDVRIAFRDVEKDRENGRLAIQQVEKVITPLKKGRKYV
ncbi:unnamed protein product [Alternaria alternata]